MPVRVIIPTPLRQYAGKKDAIEIQAKTVGEALSGLTREYCDLRKHLFTDDGKLRSFVNVYVNDEDIRYLQKEATSLGENDVISIVPSIAGGSSSVVGSPWSVVCRSYQRSAISRQLDLKGTKNDPGTEW